jgi:hypothetical protein
MRIENGYVCVAGVEKTSYTQEILFGRRVTNKGKKYESLQTNGIRAYDTLAEALEASYEIERNNGFHKIDVKNLRMTIAEKREELEKLKDQRSLVVIRLERGVNGGVVLWRLLGPRVKGRPDVLPTPAAQIIDTGFTTFRDFDQAIELGREVNRGDCGFQLASFQLENIGIKSNNS